MALKSTNSATTNGSGARKCTSWIESFVKYTDNLESTPVWCRWAAIATIAAVLERKVWVTTSRPLYPNLYTFLVGDAGLGKSRPIDIAEEFMGKIEDFKKAPTSVTMASLCDCLVEAKRVIVRIATRQDPLEYNTLTIVADELNAFMHEYSNDLIAGLTKFYDCSPYGQARRGGDLRIFLPSPQLNVLSGTTPANLLKFIPETAWEQGFTSRIIMVFSDQSEQRMINVFEDEATARPLPPEMLHDLQVINMLTGQFGWEKDWAIAMHNWREMGMKAAGFEPPSHPRLKHYCSRRFAHMIKLSMISSVDRHNRLILEKEDFNRAMAWLVEAEQRMGNIFAGGTPGEDSKAMDEVIHFINQTGRASEAQLVQWLRKRLKYGTNIPKLIEVMEKGNMIVHIDNDNMGLKIFGPGET